MGARGAPVQIRLRHGHQLLLPARREGAAVGRRQVLRPHELPQDRRPRRGRHQVGRHDAPRRQDGGGRRRSSRHRGVRGLEGEGRGEGRRPRHRLQGHPPPPRPDHEGLRELRGSRCRLLRDRAESRPEACREGGAPLPCPRQLHQARHPVRPPGVHRHPLRHLRHRLGRRGLPDGFRPELEQLRARHRRVPQGRRAGPGLGPDMAHPQGRGEDGAGPRALGEDRLCGLGLRRSRHSVPHHHQRLAHLPGFRNHPGIQSVLRVHVPRRHGLQSRLLEPAAVPRCGDRPIRWRGFRPRRPPVDGGARDLRHDGAVPVEGDRPPLL